MEMLFPSYSVQEKLQQRSCSYRTRKTKLGRS